MLVKIVSIMLNSTFTTDEIVNRITLLRTYYGVKLFAGGADRSVRDVLRGQCDEYTMEILETWERSFAQGGISPLVVYEAMDAIEEDVAGLPSVTLYIPVRLGYEQVERACKWFRDNVQPNILLTLRTDPRVGGGCAFIWKDTYYDFSLRYAIRKHREEVVHMFDTYTHA